MNTTAASTLIRPANFTRRTADIPGKLRQERSYGSLVLYHLLRLSDLAREGIERSGSYRFADHIYANRASGRGLLGRALDRILLNLPATRAIRKRCPESTSAMHDALRAHESSGSAEPFRLLTVPCGLPRDAADFADSIQRDPSRSPVHFEYTGMDIDPAVLAAARDFLAHSAVRHAHWTEGNALDADAFPHGDFHYIGSTGLGEFLDDADLSRFFANVHEHLASGGVFFTSASAHDPRSDALLRAFEFQIRYRSQRQVASLLEALPWKTIRYTVDPSGLQTFILATKV